MNKAVLSKLITVKVATIALVTTTAGGVALAAGTGELPGPFHGHHHGKNGAASKRHHKADLVVLCRLYLGEKPGKLPVHPLVPRPRPTGSWTAHPKNPLPTFTGRPQPRFPRRWAGARLDHKRHAPAVHPTATWTWTPRPKPTGSVKPRPHHKPNFAPLLKAAGGASKVKAFCTDLLSKHPAPSPKPHPTGSPTASTSPKTGSAD